MESRKAVTHRVVTAEPGHLLANELIDITFLLEQVLQLAVLILKMVHFQFQALHLALMTFPLLPLVVFQYSASKGGNMVSRTGQHLYYSRGLAIALCENRPGGFL